MHQTSYQARRVVGQIARGEELVDALTDLCKRESIHAGQIRVHGVLQHTELIDFDPTSREYRTICETEHPLTILQMNGTISTLGGQIVLRLDALLLARGPLGDQIQGGQVREALVETAEFVIEVFEDLRLERGMDASSGRLVLTNIERTAPAPATPAVAAPVVATAAPAKAPAKAPAPARTPAPTRAPATPRPAPEPAPAPQEPVSQPMSWGDAMAASDEIAKPASKRKPKPTLSKRSRTPDLFEDEEDEEDLPEMRPGDFLEHPKLGRCRIMRVEEDEYAHIRLPRGKISKLVLDLFEIKFEGEEGGKHIFRLRMRRED